MKNLWLLFVLFYLTPAYGDTTILLWEGSYFNASKATSTRAINGQYSGDTGTTTDNTFYRLSMPAGSLTALSCLSSQPGSGHSLTFTVQVNGSSSSATCTISNTGTTCLWTGTVAVNLDDYMNIAVTNSGVTNPPTDCMMKFTATTLPQTGEYPYTVENESPYWAPWSVSNAFAGD